MKEIGRNSNPNKNNKQDTLKKVQIRKKIEKTGLFARIIKIEDIIHELYDAESDEEEEIIFDDDENEIVDEFQESTCECALCQCINNVYIKWENWEPETPIQHILKRHIEQM